MAVIVNGNHYAVITITDILLAKALKTLTQALMTILIIRLQINR